MSSFVRKLEVAPKRPIFGAAGTTSPYPAYYMFIVSRGYVSESDDVKIKRKFKPPRLCLIEAPAAAFASQIASLLPSHTAELLEDP